MSGENWVTAGEIRAALEAELTPSALEIIDDSQQHAGHAGAREGRHYTVRITSSRFNGLSRIAQHRLVYHALRDLIPRGIHALAIEANSPDA